MILLLAFVLAVLSLFVFLTALLDRSIQRRAARDRRVRFVKYGPRPVEWHKDS